MEALYLILFHVITDTRTRVHIHLYTHTYASILSREPFPKMFYSSAPFLLGSPSPTLIPYIHTLFLHSFSLLLPLSFSLSVFPLLLSLSLSLTKLQDSVLIYIGLTPAAPFASAIFSKCSPCREEGGFRGPNRRQSKPHSLAATRLVRNGKRLGERSLARKERLKRKHIVRDRRDREKRGEERKDRLWARALFGAHLSLR